MTPLSIFTCLLGLFCIFVFIEHSPVLPIQQMTEMKHPLMLAPRHRLMSIHPLLIAARTPSGRQLNKKGGPGWGYPGVAP